MVQSWLFGAALAAPTTACGLTLLRLSVTSESRGLLRALGICLLFAGLALHSFRMLIGTNGHGIESEDDIVARKIMSMMQCVQVLLCWFAERHLVADGYLTYRQEAVCFVVWLGSTLVEWAAPWPYDDVGQVLNNQIAGCDGGYRKLFSFAYVPLWTTVTLFGVLLMCCGDGTAQPLSGDDSEDERDNLKSLESTPRVFRRMLLPMLYGFTMSASSLLLASWWLAPSERTQVYYIAGIVLGLCIATACSCDWILRMELNLAMWAALSQCFALLMQLLQAHLIFQDLRWHQQSGFAFLIGQIPGVYLYVTGFAMLFAVFLFYMILNLDSDEDDPDQWKPMVSTGGMSRLYSLGRSRGNSLDRTSSRTRRARSLTDEMGMGYLKEPLVPLVLQSLALVACFVCYVKGITEPLYHYSICSPSVQWSDGTQAIEITSASGAAANHECYGKTSGFVEQITWLYNNHMPFPAMLAAYRSLVAPPLEFLLMFVVLAKSYFQAMPVLVLQAVRKVLLASAAGKFATNIMVQILYVSIIQTADPGGHSFQARLTTGFAYMLVYVFLYGILVRSLDFGPEKTHAQRPESISRSISAKEVDGSDSSDSDSSDEDFDYGPLLNVIGAVSLIVVVMFAMYEAIYTPFLSIDIRYSNARLLQIHPVLHDLWETLKTINLPVAWFAATTLVFFLIARIVLWLLLHTVAVHADKTEDVCLWFIHKLLKAAENIAKTYTLCHIWAESILLLWLGLITHGNLEYKKEVCARLPTPPIGLMAIIVLGVGAPSLSKMADKLVSLSPMPSGRSVAQLPGGMFLWGILPMTVFFGLAGMLNMCGPVIPHQAIHRGSVNEVLQEVLPWANNRMAEHLPETMGDCVAFKSQQSSGSNGRCVGHSPLATFNTSRNLHVTVQWVSGLREVEIKQLSVEPTKWVSGYNDSAQRWNLTASAVFKHLRIWVKVMQEGKEILNDKMCCEDNFHFKLAIVTDCVHEQGFQPVQLSIAQMDKAELESSNSWQGVDSQGSFEIDWGDASHVSGVDLQSELQGMLKGKIRNILMRTSEGPPLDIMDFVRGQLQRVVNLNTFPTRSCPVKVPQGMGLPASAPPPATDASASAAGANTPMPPSMATDSPLSGLRGSTQ